MQTHIDTSCYRLDRNALEIFMRIARDGGVLGLCRGNTANVIFAIQCVTCYLQAVILTPNNPEDCYKSLFTIRMEAGYWQWFADNLVSGTASRCYSYIIRLLALFRADATGERCEVRGERQFNVLIARHTLPMVS